jgi:hypothetical protein
LQLRSLPAAMVANMRANDNGGHAQMRFFTMPKAAVARAC